MQRWLNFVTQVDQTTAATPEASCCPFKASPCPTGTHSSKSPALPAFLLYINRHTHTQTGTCTDYLCLDSLAWYHMRIDYIINIDLPTSLDNGRCEFLHVLILMNISHLSTSVFIYFLSSNII